jgi:putative ABC transport system substrate-binding protein
MRRRNFIIGLSSLTVAWPFATRAQQVSKIYRIGFLGADSESGMATRVESFRTGLRDLGYVEDANLVIEYRYANEKYERLPELAADLIRSNVDVIVTHGTPGSMAAKKATATIPIVMALVGDPVASGILPSLARPGGNITGQSFFAPEITAKRIQLLKEVLPQMTRLAVLFNPDNAISALESEQIEQTTRYLKTELIQIPVRGPGDFENAFARMENEHTEALAMGDDFMITVHAKTIAALTEKLRLASIGSKYYPRAGGLMGYGVDFLAMYRRAAIFVDKILKGTKPADIPIEEATKFDFILNLRTAKTLGVTISNSMQLLANEVIE